MLCEFQEYRLRKSPSTPQEEKVAKLAIFKVFPQIQADLGQLRQGVADPTKLYPNRCSGPPLWGKKPKKSFYTVFQKNVPLYHLLQL